MTKKFQYIDVHTHVNLSAFSEDREAVAACAFDSGVAYINVGTQRDTSQKACGLSNPERGVYATVGIHPIHTGASYHDTQELGDGEKGFVSRGEVFDAAYYRTLAQTEGVVAIGECGLDYYRTEQESKALQERVFIEHIMLANELKKPLMLHIRASEGSVDAYDDALKILKAHAKVRGDVHFFAGNYAVAKQFWEMGFTTSFTGVITFVSQYDEVIKNAPIEMLHAETDAPYVAPVPYRGKRNEPLHVREVYKRIAEIRGEDEEGVRLQLLKNAETLFSIAL